MLANSILVGGGVVMTIMIHMLTIYMEMEVSEKMMERSLKVF